MYDSRAFKVEQMNTLEKPETEQADMYMHTNEVLSFIPQNICVSQMVGLPLSILWGKGTYIIDMQCW